MSRIIILAVALSVFVVVAVIPNARSLVEERRRKASVDSLIDALAAQENDRVQAVRETQRAERPVAVPRSNGVYERCLRAARLQGRAADELNEPPSPTVAEARDANFQSICKITPEIFLPDLIR